MGLVFNINGSGKFTSNNNTKNLRITETPRSVRNNLFNIFTNKFEENNPVVRSSVINQPKNASTYMVGKKHYYSFSKQRTKI